MMENFHAFLERAEDGDEKIRDSAMQLSERNLQNDDDDEAAGKSKAGGFGHSL